MPIKISHQFDSGAIVVLRADCPQQIDLAIRSDRAADFSQWFHFRLQGAGNVACQIRLTNAGQTTYPDGWTGYHAVASYDRTNWFRVPSSFDGQSLTIFHTPLHDSAYYAYFEPYSWERHLDLIAHVGTAQGVAVEQLGVTLEGRSMDLISMGNPSAGKSIWVIARQHPGEAMASWFMEGMLNALVDAANPVARRLRAEAMLYIVPHMNPDGATAGNLRTNAAGVDLNRAWMAPSMETSPEVFVVRQRMHETGCHAFLDVHGDEALPYVFVAGNEMLESFSDVQARRQKSFTTAFGAASPDFQIRHGYVASKYNQDMLKLASKYVGNHFGCLSLTLEMPFKDNADLPDEHTGWSGARSARLGASVLQPLLQSLA
jgi:murein tripeptide amidase MpaA